MKNQKESELIVSNYIEMKSFVLQYNVGQMRYICKKRIFIVSNTVKREFVSMDVDS